MTTVLRALPSRMSEPRIISRKGKINELVRNSTMRVSAQFGTVGPKWVIIEISGPLAKLPSTTNSKLLTVPRFHILKMIDRMIENAAERTRQGLVSLKNSVRSLRATMTRNPDHMDQLMALTALWNSATKEKELKFPLDKDNRGAVFVLLSPQMNRMDTHNIPKAVCDWLQEMEVISNDRHVDAFARRSADLGIKRDESYIILMRYDDLSPKDQTFETALNIAKKVYGDNYFIAISNQISLLKDS